MNSEFLVGDVGYKSSYIFYNGKRDENIYQRNIKDIKKRNKRMNQ